MQKKVLNELLGPNDGNSSGKVGFFDITKSMKYRWDTLTYRLHKKHHLGFPD